MKPKRGIAVDGACSGNPGPGEYRGINLLDGKELFRLKLSCTTNNLMEFFAIVHAAKYIKDNKLNDFIYSDSECAIAWVKNKQVNTSLVEEEASRVTYKFIRKCLLFLQQDAPKTGVSVEKWKTKEWGEIPADFGNKKGGTIVKPPTNEKIEEWNKNKKNITKQELKEWADNESKQSFADPITLMNLKKHFNL